MTYAYQAPSEEEKTARDILACLENNGPLSRATIAKRLGLSRTTISTLMTKFIDLGLVSELKGEDPKGRGRPGIPVDLDTEQWFAMGAEYYSGRWVFAIVSLKGEVILTKALPTSSNTPKSFLSTLTKGIGLMLAACPGRPLPAVGIGVPGLVNWESGTIIRADDLGWRRVGVREAVEKATGLATFVLNRNRAAGIAEARFGLGKNSGNFVYIGVGTGISAAIMLGGNLLNGAGYSAGEIGHITVDPDGPPCRCGRRGCLQTLASGSAMARRAGELHRAGEIRGGELAEALAKGGKIGGEMVYRAALAGDSAALACVQEAAEYLAVTIGSLITTLNPEKIIIGGPLVRAGALLVDKIRAATENWSMSDAYAMTVIEPSGLGEYAGALGSASLVLRHKLELSQKGAIALYQTG